MPIKVKPHQAHPALPSAKPCVQKTDTSAGQHNRTETPGSPGNRLDVKQDNIILDFKEADVRSFLNVK